MAAFKCKMCGGDLELIEGQTVCECEYCGSRQTLPKLDDERKLNLYDRANHFRRNNEFDKAAGMYERILNDDTTDAEAYWSLVLCKYGIEYVEDPATHKRLPTVNRAQYTSIFADENYKKAIEYADPTQREVYEAEAKAIDEIQKGILEISSKEEPFDVFICYKETDNAGRRTPDSVLATELYHELTKEGFKVFFSRITLEDKLGTAYEPYIFAALHSAKAMVVLGTRAEYFNAVWVKNEWSRYLNLIQSGEKKTLIPAYRDMDPYDLPEEFSHLQAQDMSKLGFMQDLIRGIKKILDADKKPEPVKETVVVQQTAGNATLTAQIKRGQIALEDRDWTAADSFFDKALDIDAECAEAYFGKALAEAKCVNGEELVQKRLAIPVTETETLTACEKDTARINKAVKTYTVPGYYQETDIRQAFENDERTYSPKVSAWEQRLRAEETYWERDRQLSRAVRYAKGDFAEKLKGFRAKIEDSLKDNLASSKNADKTEAERVRANYAKMLDAAESFVQGKCEAAIARRQKDYDDAVQLQKSGKEEADFRKAAALFEKAGDFEDAPRLKEQCLQIADDIKAEKERIAKELAEQKAAEEAREVAKRKRKVKMLGIITAAILAVIAITTVVLTQIVIPAVRYNKAEALLEAGDYDGAEAAFAALGDYKDSADRFSEIKYAEAEALLEAGDKAGAAFAFGALGDYKDARSCANSLWSELADRKTIAAGYDHTVALKSDGTVVATDYTGDYYDGQCDVVGWTDIVAIAVGSTYTVGLKSDGTVVAVGDNNYSQCDVDDWTDIVAVAAGDNHTVGLKSDGTVVVTDYSGKHDYGQCDVGGWTDIVAVAAGVLHTVGLKSDGTVVATDYTGDYYHGQCDVGGWRDIVDIDVGDFYTVGLKSDGTVVATDYTEDQGFYHGQCDVSGWTDIKLPNKKEG